MTTAYMKNHLDNKDKTLHVTMEALFVCSLANGHLHLSERKAGSVECVCRAEELLVEEGQIVLEPDVKPAVSLRLVLSGQRPGPDTGEDRPPHVLWERLLQSQTQYTCSHGSVCHCGPALLLCLQTHIFNQEYSRNHKRAWEVYKSAFKWKTLWKTQCIFVINNSMDLLPEAGLMTKNTYSLKELGGSVVVVEDGAELCVVVHHIGTPQEGPQLRRRDWVEQLWGQNKTQTFTSALSVGMPACH